MTDDEHLIQATERVLIAMFGGARTLGAEKHIERIVSLHRVDQTVEWKQARNYAKAALSQPIYLAEAK